jgi:hypothetical protein
MHVVLQVEHRPPHPIYPPFHQQVILRSAAVDRDCKTAPAPGAVEFPVPVASSPTPAPPSNKELLAGLDTRLRAAVPSEDSKAPASLDDALAVLRADRLDRFVAAIAYCDTQSGVEAQALAAQLELALGEAQLDAATILDLGAAAASAADLARRSLDAVRGTADRTAGGVPGAQASRDLAGALRAAGAAHLQAAHTRVEALLRTSPDDYRVHRIAADYYRLRGDWAAFQIAAQRVEELNKDSNGLRYLRGLQAWESGDAPRGRVLMDEALAADPSFTRVRAQRFLREDALPARCAAFAELVKAEPAHALAVLGQDAMASQCPAK